MHRFATSKMKIELPWRCVPPPQSRMLVATERNPHILHLDVVTGRPAVFLPAAQHEFDPGIRPVPVKWVECARFMVTMSGRIAGLT